MKDGDSFAAGAPFAGTRSTARDAATVARLLAARPPRCPLVRAALARVLMQTLGAWSLAGERDVRPQPGSRRTLEPALQTARALQPRKGNAR